MERRIRDSKRKCMGLKHGVDNATTDEAKESAEALYQKEAALLQKRNKAYNDFCEGNGLKRKSERITIAQWDREQAAKARAAAKQYEKSIALSSKTPYTQEKLSITVEKAKKKGIIKLKNNDLENGLPIKGTALTIVDKTDDFGVVLQRRIYGADGMASVDFDTSDHGLPKAHPTGAHKHIFDYSRKKPRQKPDKLTGEELEINKDIIQKGVNYHDNG